MHHIFYEVHTINFGYGLCNLFPFPSTIHTHTHKCILVQAHEIKNLRHSQFYKLQRKIAKQHEMMKMMMTIKLSHFENQTSTFCLFKWEMMTICTRYNLQQKQQLLL